MLGKDVRLGVSGCDSDVSMKLREKFMIGVAASIKRLRGVLEETETCGFKCITNV